MKLLVRFAAAGCRDQPGEKSEYKIAGKPMPSRRKGEIPCQRQRHKSKKKKDPTLHAPLLSVRPEVAIARRAKAIGEDPKGPNSLKSELTITNPDAARIDVGARTHYVAVPEGRAEVSVRSFGAYSAQLDELAQWLTDCGITTVAMESTGVYWVSLYLKLEEAGFEVLLVDAHQAKHVPVRKSYFQDCQWLQQLHCYSLLRAAFRPEDSICRLRSLQRHRKSLVVYAAMCIQHIQKALYEMNLHLHHVLSDISGQSGLSILDAILAGERDPRKLASLAHYRVHKSQAQIEAALTGDYRPELLFVLSQALQNYRQIQQQIAQCDLRVEKQLAQIADCTNPSQASEPTPPAPYSARGKPRKTKPKDALELSLAGHLKRILGVDLTTIPGLNVLAILSLLSDIGTYMAKWRNEKAFLFFLFLSPYY